MNIYTPKTHTRTPQKSAWYLVQCKPRQDERAEEHLTRQGYGCMRPVCSRDRIVRGQRTHLQESLFPGYLFINLPDDTNWAPLRSTRGVNRVVSFGGKPLPVSWELITQLRNRVEVSQPAFAVGDRVRILEGGLAALDAIFMSADGEERVILLINLLHRQQTVSMPLVNVSAF
ncbi:transcription/translation regulatory transformer protein RfaH [Pseudomonas sp. LB3P81]